MSPHLRAPNSQQTNTYFQCLDFPSKKIHHIATSNSAGGKFKININIFEVEIMFLKKYHVEFYCKQNPFFFVLSIIMGGGL